MINSRTVVSWFTPAFVFFILTITLNSCGYKEIQFETVDDIEVSEIHDSVAQVNLLVTITNPNNKEIVVNDLNGFIVLNSVDVGQVSLLKEVKIPSNGTHQVNIPVILNLKSSPLAIAAGLGLGLLTNNIVIKISGSGKGKMGLLSITFPINHEQKIPAKDIEGLWN